MLCFYFIDRVHDRSSATKLLDVQHDADKVDSGYPRSYFPVPSPSSGAPGMVLPLGTWRILRMSATSRFFAAFS